MKFIYYLTGKERDTFWLAIEEFKRNVVLSLESAINCVNLEMHLKNIETCVGNMTTIVNSILSSGKIFFPSHLLTSIFRFQSSSSKGIVLVLNIESYLCMCIIMLTLQFSKLIC